MSSESERARLAIEVADASVVYYHETCDGTRPFITNEKYLAWVKALGKYAEEFNVDGWNDDYGIEGHRKAVVQAAVDVVLKCCGGNSVRYLQRVMDCYAEKQTQSGADDE